MIEVKAPGKLYIAGEYAVLEYGHPAIIVALDHYITATIKETSNNFGTITSIYSHNKPISFERIKSKATLSKKNKDFRYVMTAINITEHYVLALGKKLQFFDLNITSSLDNNGTKYGFGSSGAVTVATVKALLKFYKIKATHDLVYKLAVLTQIKLKENGSFGDIAASTYGGFIAYSMFDKSWLFNKFEEVPFTELIHTQWSNLRIEPLPSPNFNLLIGWTKTPASTSNLVDQVKEDLSNHTFSKLDYNSFLKKAKYIVEKMIQAFYQNNTTLIYKNLNNYRNLLLEFSKMSNITIETPTLKLLVELANSLNVAAKSSGAGGGDCGIALVDNKEKELELAALWEKNGIVPLTNVKVHFERDEF